MSQKILLVEDNTILALSEARSIQKYGFEIETVYKGNRAIELAISDPNISLVLMDIELETDLSGIEAARKIVENRNLPIVFLTAHTEMEYLEKIDAVPNYGLIQKNSCEAILIQTIKNALALFEKNNELRRKELETRALLDNIDSAVIKLDSNGAIRFFNKGAERIFGFTAEEIIGKTETETILPTYDGRGRDLKKMYKELISKTEKYSYNENENVRKDGTRLTMAWRNTKVFNKEGSLLYIQSIATDITQRKKAEEKVRRSAEEKDLLMRELNHRVKNNLSMISSLIHLKEHSLEGSVDLSDIEHQIDAIRILHEKLSKTEHITYIKVRDYIQDILSGLFHHYSQYKVEIENEIEDIQLPTRQSITLGLITNEIATNAVKYGFNGKSNSRFRVELKEYTNLGLYVYKLANNGVSFPEEVNLEDAESLGLQLIRTLVKQLDGSIELLKSPSPTFTISFPIPEELRKEPAYNS